MERTCILLCINLTHHVDVIKWNHFQRYWPFVRGIHRSPVNSPHKGQWPRALMFSLICTRINGWVKNGEAGDLRRRRAHYDVIVMLLVWMCFCHSFAAKPLSKDDSREPNEHIEAETRWPPFYRRYFQMYFLEWKFMNFDLTFIDICFLESN